MRRPRFSLQGRLALRLGLILAAVAALCVWLVESLDYWPLALPLVLLVALLAMVIVLRSFFEPLRDTLRALHGGVASFRDHDYSVQIAVPDDDELGQLVAVYNELAGILREERFDLFQRELLLDTVIQTSTVAVLICNDQGRVIFSNREARGLLNLSGPAEGYALMELVAEHLPMAVDILKSATDGLFTLELDGQPEVYHLTYRRFNLNVQVNHLYLFKRLTREIARQEVNTWKKVIRVISHELNNSLAPISSLTNSARTLLQRAGPEGPDPEPLGEILESIGERSSHLHGFIEQYARFARLPQPRPQPVEWEDFIDRLEGLYPFRLSEALPEEPARFDPAQMEQVLINLLKNAHESGSAPEQVTLSVLQNADHCLLAVEDRGKGLDQEQIQLALLPFYSTKRRGSGIGLPLCREIVEAHGGTFRIFNREGGGVAATCKLPLRRPAAAAQAPVQEA